MCLCCLCSATWAWFTADLTSNENTIGTGVFNIDVSVTNENGTAVSSPRSGGEGVLAIKLIDDGRYTVTITPSADTTVSKGFCIIRTADNTYFTDVIYADASEAFVFTLETSNTDITISFSPAWGIPAYPNVYSGETLIIE